MKKEFFWTCVNNPFKDIEILSEVIDNAKEISFKEFVKECNIEKEILEEMIIYWSPSFSFWKNGDIYFYVWSAIEHFYE